MKYRYLLFLLLITLAPAQAQTVINNTLTDKHQTIYGKGISIVPPAGFVIGTDSNFIDTGRNAGINLLKASAAIIEETGTKNLFRLMFNNVLQQEEYRLNNARGTLATGNRAEQNQQGALGGLYVFVLRNKTEGVIVQAYFDWADTALALEIKQSLLSIIYEPAPPEALQPPFQEFDFTVDVTGTGYEFVQLGSGIMIFAPRGELDLENPETIFLAGQTDLPEGDTTDRKKFIKEQMLNDGLLKGKGKAPVIKEVTLNGLPGYAVTISEKNKTTGQTDQAYLVMLFGKHMYLVGGVYTKPEQLMSIKKAVATFKLTGK